jgi:hypothetical protein
VEIIARSLNETPVSDPNAIIERAGVFSFLSQPAGTYRLSILGVPPPFYVKAVNIGSGPDVLDVGFSVPTAQSMEIVIAGDGAEVRGLVREGGGSTILLVPEGRPMLRADLYKTARADDQGSFVIRGIAPGAYRLFATRAIASIDMVGNLFFDSDYLRPFMSLATPLRIAAGSSTVVDLGVLSGSR